MLPTPVWALIFIVVIGLTIGGLIVLYYKVRPKSPSGGAPKAGDVGFERENRLFTLFQNIEDMMDGFDSYVEETRAALEMERVEFLREKEEITRLNAQVRATLQQFREEIEAARVVDIEPWQEVRALPPSETAQLSEPERVVTEPAFPEPVVAPTSARAASIWSLYREGRRGDEIAKELGIALGEVNLTLKVLTGGGR